MYQLQLLLIRRKGYSMKKRNILIIMFCTIMCVCSICYFKLNNDDYLEDNWNLNLKFQANSIFEKYPEPSFHNDGIYYEVFEIIKHNSSIDFNNNKNSEIEMIFLEYTSEASISEEYLPCFSNKYQYYTKNKENASLIIINQNQKLYVVSYKI